MGLVQLITLAQADLAVKQLGLFLLPYGWETPSLS